MECLKALKCYCVVSCCIINLPLCSQRCDIGDASRGSLSSYAYILMVLYFLQQRQPPVIPVLQEVLYRLNSEEMRYTVFEL